MSFSGRPFMFAAGIAIIMASRGQTGDRLPISFLGTAIGRFVYMKPMRAGRQPFQARFNCQPLAGIGEMDSAYRLPMNLRPGAAPTLPLPPGEGGAKGRVRERPPDSWAQFVAAARPGGLSHAIGIYFMHSNVSFICHSG